MFDKIRYWLTAKVFHWNMESRFKFIRLSEHRTLYVHYSWENDKIGINLYDPKSDIRTHIFDLSLDDRGNVESVKSKGIEIYEKEKEEE